MQVDAELPRRPEEEEVTPVARPPADVPPPRTRRLGLKAFGLFAKVVHRLSWRLRLLEYALPAIEREITSTVKVPWRIRMRMWRQGFLSEAWVLYSLAENDPARYLGDIERFVGTRLINGFHGVLLDDKLQFARLFEDEQLSRFVPPLYGVLRGGRVVPMTGRARGRSLAELLVRVRELVLKPSGGGGGLGFFHLEIGDDSGVRCNGKAVGNGELARIADTNDGCMVTGYVRQHPALRALYPRTTNTLRVVTMQDETMDPFIAAAVLRVGTSASEPTDNWRGGGLSASIDPEVGTLGKAADFPEHADRLTWHARHPETGTQIEGMTVPHWQMIEREIREVARRLPFVPYVGWDLVVTEEGFSILEGNNYSGVGMLQIHQPLLADPRVEDFFRRHGALRGRRRTAPAGG